MAQEEGGHPKSRRSVAEVEQQEQTTPVPRSEKFVVERNSNQGDVTKNDKGVKEAPAKVITNRYISIRGVEVQS